MKVFRFLMSIIGFILTLPFMVLLPATPIVNMFFAIWVAQNLNEALDLNGFAQIPLFFILPAMAMGYTALVYKMMIIYG